MCRISENIWGNFSEISEILEISWNFGNFGILGNIRVPLLEILEFLEICAIQGSLLQILQTCKEFSALQPQITASSQIVVLSWFKLSPQNSGKFRNCKNCSNRNPGFYRLQRCLWTRTLETGVEFTLDVIPEQLMCGLCGGYHIYIYI